VLDDAMDRSGGRNFRIAGRRIVALEGAAPKRAGPTIRKLPAGRLPRLAKNSQNSESMQSRVCRRSNRHTLTKWSPPQLAASSSVIRTARTSDDRSCAGFLDAGEYNGSHALDRPASKKRQGTKSRSVVRERCGARYWDLSAA